MLLIVVEKLKSGSLSLSQERVVELQMVVNWCICNGRIGVWEGYRFLFCLRRGVTCLLGKNKGRATKFFRKKMKNTPTLPLN